MDKNSFNRLALRINDLCRVLNELEGASKPELREATEALYVPKVPTQSGMKGMVPLDSQLMATASNAAQAVRECDEAAADYDTLAKRVTTILNSPILKSMDALTKAGKAKAKARRAECEKMHADAQTELARRQQAREQALTELEKAKEVEDEVKRMRQEIATLRATFL